MENNIFIKISGLCLFLITVLYLSPLMAQEDDCLEYIKNNDLMKIKELINAGVDVNQKFKYDDTLLMYTAFTGNREIAEMLLSKKANINATNVDGRSAIMIASLMGKENIVDLLIKNGASMKIEDKNNKTALIWAVAKNQPEIVEMLVNAGADINQQTRDGRTALMEAACVGYVDIIKLLISKGASLDLRDDNNATALTLAFEFDQSEAARILKTAGTPYSSPRVSRKEWIKKWFPKGVLDKRYEKEK